MHTHATIHVVSGAVERRIHVRAGSSTLARFLAEAGLALNTRCNERGLCRGCTVLVGEQPPRNLLACQYKLTAGEHLNITIPSRSFLSHPPSVVSDFQTGIPVGSDPIFDSPDPLGIAVDIGTTTVAIMLVELSSGRVLARASALNSQVSLGDNVLTRIHLCQEEKSNIARLQSAFWKETFQPLLSEILDKEGSSPSEIAGVVVAGNTTMLHLACGEDPTSMGAVPFTPKFLEQRLFSGDEFGAPVKQVIFLPGVSSFVGADISAGAVCCGVRYGVRPELLVDVGTNGEMLLCGPKGLLACATAAGPAFEGCGLLCGMRAAHGVVGRIECILENEGGLSTRIEIIGGGENSPHGITGSAYVDFLAEGRRIGLLQENGRFEESFITANPGRFLRDQNGWSLLLAPAHPDLRIGEVDVALLLQAKAAIAAGIETLLRLQGLLASDIGRVHLAGGFGLHLSIPNAIACGLLPGFRAEQVHAVGNTSLGGAYLGMLDRSLVTEMNDLREQITTVELNLDPEFEDRFLDHLSLPCPGA